MILWKTCFAREFTNSRIPCCGLEDTTIPFPKTGQRNSHKSGTEPMSGRKFSFQVKKCNLPGTFPSAFTINTKNEIEKVLNGARPGVFYGELYSGRCATTLGTGENLAQILPYRVQETLRHLAADSQADIGATSDPHRKESGGHSILMDQKENETNGNRNGESFQDRQFSNDMFLRRTIVERRVDNEKWKTVDSFACDRFEQKSSHQCDSGIQVVVHLQRDVLMDCSKKHGQEFPDTSPEQLSNITQHCSEGSGKPQANFKN